MTGLLLKDLYNLRKSLRTIGLLIVVYAAIFIHQGVDFLQPLLILLCSMMVITSFSYDSQCKWDGYAMAMPLSRGQMVGAKYLLLLFFCLLGGAAALGVGALSGALGQPVNWPEQLTFVALLLCVAIIFSSIALPLLYKFGAERARLLLVMCYLLPIAAIMLLGKILPAYVLEALHGPMDYINQNITWLLPAASAVALAISYACALAIFRKKELQ
nr:ABC-2 transporter permease [Maliibacterium massiliense]